MEVLTVIIIVLLLPMIQDLIHCLIIVGLVVVVHRYSE